MARKECSRIDDSRRLLGITVEKTMDARVGNWGREISVF
jgi:hypothetical protein